MRINIGLACILFLIVLSNVNTSSNQYLPVVRNTSKPDVCAGVSKTALVEHFFNVIFTEFHNTPPICVCVKMCSDQPTYCYPNGCLKKVEVKKKTPDDNRPAPVANAPNVDKVNKLFLVDDKNDYTHMLNENAESKAVPPKRPTTKEMRPDPFKDRYKILFKYKKLPKVELRYNLREQVKNMKSDILKVETKDVSKTRWPNVNHMVFNEQQVHKTNEKKSDKKTSSTGSANTQFFLSDGDSYTSRYFKRDLRRNLKDGNDVETEYLTEKNDPLDNKNFSIEALIENLIGNNFEEKRDTHSDLSIVFIDPPIHISNKSLSANETEHSSNNTKGNKDQTCIVSMNMTNQNLDENKYTEVSPLVKDRMNKWQNYTFNQMIAALAKRIEKQNNTSMEIFAQASSNNAGVTPENIKHTQKVHELNIEEKNNVQTSLTDDIQTVIITSKNKEMNISLENQEKIQTY